MAGNNGIELMGELMRVCESGERMPSHLSNWLVAGVREWQASRGNVSLEDALEIQSAPDWEAIRNEWIRKAAQSIDKPSAWQTARALSDEIKEFHDGVWPNTKHLSEPPKLSRLRYALWQAFKANSYLPSRKNERRFPTVPQAIANLIRTPT